MRVETHRFLRAALLGPLFTVSLVAIAEDQIRHRHLDSALRQSLTRAQTTPSQKERTNTARAVFEAYCASTLTERREVSDGTVRRITEAASHANDLAAFFYIRALGAMGGRAATALPTLKSGIRTTVDPGRMFGNVEIGAAPPVESVRKAAVGAIENDSPMSCSLDDTY